MNKLIIAAVFAAVPFLVHAQEASTTPVIVPIVAETAELVVNAIFIAVCTSEYILSPKAIAACASETMPKATKRGDRFTAAGLGNEFNTLYRQIKG